MDNIIFIGMPGSGKSTAGVLVAKALGYDFIDTDLIIQQREQALLQEIIRDRGNDALLDAEEAAICSVCCRHAVISPGGSCVYRPRAMEHLKKLGKIVYLELSLETLEGRIHNMDSRGIALDPGETLADLYNRRTPLYRRYADLTIGADGQTLDETVAAVLRVLDGRL